jgi:hypothetical protein
METNDLFIDKGHLTAGRGRPVDSLLSCRAHVRARFTRDGIVLAIELARPFVVNRITVFVDAIYGDLHAVAHRRIDGCRDLGGLRFEFCAAGIAIAVNRRTSWNGTIVIRGLLLLSLWVILVVRARRLMPAGRRLPRRPSRRGSC